MIPNPRALAATLLAKVITEKQSLTAVLKNAFSDHLTHQDRALLQALCYGVMRYLPQLQLLAQQLLSKPLKAKDQDIYCLLLSGFYQLVHMRIPAHAAVMETVTACDALQKTWAKALINGVLRRFLREQEQHLTEIDQNPEVRYNHPRWLIDAISAAWPEQWQNILHANNQQAPLTLRINPRHNSVADYLDLLKQAGMEAQPTRYSPQGIQLAQAVEVSLLPRFTDGAATVQDEAGQLAIPLLDLKPGQRILDACAAPGTKTSHIFEVEPDVAEVIALDIDPHRLAKIGATIKRMGLPEQDRLKLICADANHIKSWWDGRKFDRILIDAPCSATGVIRRHPDIKFLKRPSDIAFLAQQQLKLLNSLWPLLKPEGVLLYTTCSVLPQENSLLVEAFLAGQNKAQSVSIPAQYGIAQTLGRQTLPGMDNRDGFYYCVLCFEKNDVNNSM